MYEHSDRYCLPVISHQQICQRLAIAASPCANCGSPNIRCCPHNGSVCSCCRVVKMSCCHRRGSGHRLWRDTLRLRRSACPLRFRLPVRHSEALPARLKMRGEPRPLTRQKLSANFTARICRSVYVDIILPVINATTSESTSVGVGQYPVILVPIAVGPMLYTTGPLVPAYPMWKCAPVIAPLRPSTEILYARPPRVSVKLPYPSRCLRAVGSPAYPSLSHEGPCLHQPVPDRGFLHQDSLLCEHSSTVVP